MHITRKQWITALKIIVNAGLLLFIAMKIDWHKSGDIVKGANHLYLSLAVALLFVELVLMSVRLKILMTVNDTAVSFGQLYKLNLMSVFVGIFLPTKLGVDGLRVYYLSRHTKTVSNSLSSIAYDRLLNIATVTLFATVGFFAGGYNKTLPELYAVMIPMALGLIAIGAVGVKRVRSFFRTVLTALRVPQKAVEFTDSVIRDFLRLKEHPRQVLFLACFSVLFQSTRVMVAYMFARSFGITAPLGFFFIIVPITIIIGMLPISVAGLGITQGTAVYLMSLIGISTELSFSYSMAGYIGRFIVAAPGAYYFFHEGLDEMISSMSKLSAAVRIRKKKKPSDADNGE